MSRPWMPLYVADYLADTAHLNAAESGAYLHLIMHYWQRGGLPDDDVLLARIAKMTPAEFSNARALLQQFFSNGWTHDRIDRELADAKAAYERRAMAGKRGGEAKSAKMASNATAMPDQCQSNAVAMQKQSQSQSQLSSSLRSEANALASEFAQQFWVAWPHKVGKPDAEKSFFRARRAGARLEDILAGVERYIRDKPADRPWLNPATFLNQRRWEDAPAPTPAARAGPAYRADKNGVGYLLAEEFLGTTDGRHEANYSETVRALPLAGDGERGADGGDDGGVSGGPAGLLIAGSFRRM